MIGKIELKIDQIFLDKENPRISKATSQNDALEKILDDKILVLAKDIIEKGLSPQHNLLVVQEKNEKNKYTVLDGNRRLAALKALSNPSVLDGINVSPKLKTGFQRLASGFKKNSIEPISCYNSKNRQEAKHWIESSHIGENKGRGQVPWNYKDKLRYKGETSTLEVLEFVKKNGNLNKKDLTPIESGQFPTSTLERLVKTPAIGGMLGFEVKNGKLKFKKPKKDLIKPFERIVSDLASKKIKVTDLIKVEQQKAYISKVLKETQKQEKKEEEKPPPAKPSNRNTLIPKSANLSIPENEPRSAAIFQELKDLKLSKHKNAISVLFRVFLELSIIHYYSKNKQMSRKVEGKKVEGKKDKSPEKDKNLNKMIHEVLKDLEEKKAIDRSAFSALSRTFNPQKSYLSTTDLNDFVHNPKLAPLIDDLETYWDNSRILFEKIWQ